MPFGVSGTIVVMLATGYEIERRVHARGQLQRAQGEHDPARRFAPRANDQGADRDQRGDSEHRPPSGGDHSNVGAPRDTPGAHRERGHQVERPHHHQLEVTAETFASRSARS